MSNRGFTLVELIAALAISSILLSLALPSFESMIEHYRTTSRVNSLIGLVRFARQAAVMERNWVTLCPARTVGDNQICTNSRQWQSGIMAFSDLNRNGVKESQERLLAYQPALKSGETLYWRAFRNRNYIQFTSAGYTNWQNGSFQYCPASRDPHHSKVIIINIPGRATPSVDSDGDGIDEYANGNPLACS